MFLGYQWEVQSILVVNRVVRHAISSHFPLPFQILPGCPIFWMFLVSLPCWSKMFDFLKRCRGTQTSSMSINDGGDVPKLDHQNTSYFGLNTSGVWFWPRPSWIYWDLTWYLSTWLWRPAVGYQAPAVLKKCACSLGQSPITCSKRAQGFMLSSHG